MKIDFTVIAFVYEPSIDQLDATVERADANERFAITASFLDRRTTIVDETPGELSEYAPHYPAEVLVAFMREFNSRYLACDSAASPQEAAFLSFSVEATS